jgi:hypothetical protein
MGKTFGSTCALIAAKLALRIFVADQASDCPEGSVGCQSSLLALEGELN